jgi:hypothetical protein
LHRHLGASIMRGSTAYSRSWLHARVTASHGLQRAQRASDSWNKDHTEKRRQRDETGHKRAVNICRCVCVNSGTCYVEHSVLVCVYYAVNCSTPALYSWLSNCCAIRAPTCVPTLDKRMYPLIVFHSMHRRWLHVYGLGTSNPTDSELRT